MIIGETFQIDYKHRWFRYDYDSCDGKMAWEIFCDVQEYLRENGWELDDPQIEHDCLTGYLKEYNGVD